jgi:sucrose-6-phosphatase
MADLNAHLAWHRWEYGTRIVYATGRSRTSYQQLIAATPLLPPDVLITAVGTEIYHNQDSVPDPVWAQSLTPQWDRELVVATASHFPALTPQPDSEQRPFKVSYTVTPHRAAESLPQLQSALRECALDIQLIYSGGKDLDILPRRADKGAAMTYVRDYLEMPSDRTIACGDSGNDIALFADRSEFGIIVGNALPELLRWHHAHPHAHRYLATAHCAAGMLEGLQYFGFL